MIACPGCGGLFPELDGPTHPYMLSSPGCWAAYGDLLAREYGDPPLFAAVHRLSVDAYALNHPGEPTDRRAIQSVWLHFGSLYLIFERGRSHAEATASLKQWSGTRFPPLPPTPRFYMTIADFDPADHRAAALSWARAAFDDWSALLDETRIRFAQA